MILLSLLVQAVALQSSVFRTTTQGGFASFVDPSGKPFWSFGVCCVNEGTAWADYDTKNPSYAAHRLFPTSKEWVADTQSKLSKWGFNSVGGWSSHELLRRHGSQMPYFVVLHLGAYDQAPWHDLFSPKMEKAVDQAAKEQIAKLGDDPLLVGYFTDNELGWWDDTLFKTYLAMPMTAPGKQHLMKMLRAMYGGDFTKLGGDWITACQSFEELAAKPDLKIRPGGKAMQFLNMWMASVGKRYYKLVSDTIRKYDKKRLILGDRYAQYYTPYIAMAAKDYVDVVSTNLGAEWNDGTVSKFYLKTLSEATGKPVLVSEFYMCAKENRSGNKNSSGGFPVVGTQAERAAAFSRYMNSVASLPNVIGAHWFQFYDEPAAGRGDGENYNMGLVDTAGKPYEELTSAAAGVDFKRLRAENLEVVDGAVMLAPAHVMDGLKSWPRESCFIPPVSKLPIADLYATWDESNLYLGLYAMDFVDEGLYVDGRIPDEERSCWTIRLAGLEKPIEVRFGGKNRAASVSGSGVEVSEIPGIKHTVIVKIPRAGLQEGQQLALKSELFTHSRGERVRWDGQYFLGK